MDLLDPVHLGRLRLPNRIIMAPLTRNRAGAEGLPGSAAELYYGQRSGAGLIVSEGVAVSPQGVAHPRIPGIWSAPQQERWASVVSVVHDAGGRIALQLWHAGRASHPSLQPDGRQQVGPSAIAINGLARTRHGRAPHEVPRELDAEEIPAVVRQFADAAARALDAGFDAVEIHGANGYLIDQFLQDSANRRLDEYGGTIQNRARFLFDVVEAVVGVWGTGRVGVRISPSSTFQDMTDSAPEDLFEYVLSSLSRYDLAYVHVVEPGVSGAQTAARPADAIDSAWAAERFGGAVVAAGNHDYESATSLVRSGTVAAVAFGRAYLANPDLPVRFASGAGLNAPDLATFYTPGEAGYIDYPSLEAERLYARFRSGELPFDEQRPDLGGRTELADWAKAWAVSRLRRDRSASA